VADLQHDYRDFKVAALGGGHGLPSVLRALKPYTREITAIVTVADDGGSSGKLRREMGMIPPGDLRNNIAALADDEALMTQLFQYRFSDGALEGHAFGNLLLAALTNITGSMVKAVVEAGHVLKIQGQVLPATLQDVHLAAEIRNSAGEVVTVSGESAITAAGGVVQRVFLEPDTVRAYPDTVRAILAADVIVFGPGSLFTSTLPSLLVNGIVEAIRAAAAPCIYVCNIATQKGETSGFTVADHLAVLDAHIGAGLIDAVICNTHYPPAPEYPNTHYVVLSDADRARLSNTRLIEADLTDPDYPWRHDPVKLANAIFEGLKVIA
jgi:uncharacterized cofD-like protein